VECVSPGNRRSAIESIRELIVKFCMQLNLPTSCAPACILCCDDYNVTDVVKKEFQDNGRSCILTFADLVKAPRLLKEPCRV
jgi:hypothetical protein